MPSSNTSRAIGLYRIQVSATSQISSRNEPKRFTDQHRKTRDALSRESADVSFEEVLRRMKS